MGKIILICELCDNFVTEDEIIENSSYDGESYDICKKCMKEIENAGAKLQIERKKIPAAN